MASAILAGAAACSASAAQAREASCTPPSAAIPKSAGAIVDAVACGALISLNNGIVQNQQLILVLRSVATRSKTKCRIGPVHASPDYIPVAIYSSALKDGEAIFRVPVGLRAFDPNAAGALATGKNLPDSLFKGKSSRGCVLAGSGLLLLAVTP